MRVAAVSTFLPDTKIIVVAIEEAFVASEDNCARSLKLLLLYMWACGFDSCKVLGLLFLLSTSYQICKMSKIWFLLVSASQQIEKRKVILSWAAWGETTFFRSLWDFLCWTWLNVQDVLAENIIGRKLRSMNVYQLLHIGWNTFIEIISGWIS